MGSKLKLALLGGALSPFIFGVSTFNAVKSQAGPAALVFAMEDKTQEWGAYLEAINADADKAKAALDVITPIEASICEMAQLEHDSGLISGSRGTGAISSQYAQVCLQTRSIAQTLQDTALESEARNAEQMSIYSQMRGVARDSSQPVFDRVHDDYEPKQDKLQALARASSNERVAERLQAQLRVLESSVVAADVQDGEFGDVQREAIGSLSGYVSAIRETVSDFIAPTDETVAPVRPDPLPDMMQAIIAHRDRLWSAILLCVGVDMIILWQVGALGVSLAIKRNRERAALEAFPPQADTSPQPANA